MTSESKENGGKLDQPSTEVDSSADFRPASVTGKDPNDVPTINENRPGETIVGSTSDSQVRAHPRTLQTSLDIPGYSTQYKLGQGGMGSVYLAIDEKLGRRVAIKVISGAALDNKSRNRFAAEIQTVAALKHPNIAQLYSADERAGVPYFVMEFVDGPTLKDQIGLSPQKPKSAAELMLVLADAIKYCHEQGIVHRDLKPSNVLMESGGFPKIADFGLAKAFETDNSTTKTGEVLGTPSYMAPEQAIGDIKSTRPVTDVYGLGAILYHLLTGRPPFNAPSGIQTINQVISDDPISIRKLQKDVPRDLETICLKCLEKSPERRYGSARELSDDLQRYIDEKPILARPITFMERTAKWVRRQPAFAALIGLCLVGIPSVITSLVIYNWSLDTALQNEQAAKQEIERQLARSERLSNQGSELSVWLINEHSSKLTQLPGALEIRKILFERVKDYLNESTPDMPQKSKFVRRFAYSYANLAGAVGGEKQSSFGQTEDALELYETSIALLDRAIELEPGDASAQYMKANYLLELTDVHMALGNAQKTEQTLAQAEALWETLKSEGLNKDQLRERQGIHFGFLQTKIGLQIAKQEYDEAIKELNRLAKAIEPGPNQYFDSNELQHYEVWTNIIRSEVLTAQGKFEKAQQAAKNATDIAKSVYEASPENPRRLNSYANALNALADLKSLMPGNDEALSLYLKVQELRETYLAQNPSDSFSKHNLANAKSMISRQYFQAEEFDKYLEYALANTSLRRDILGLSPTNVDSNRALVISLIGEATAYSFLKQHDQAMNSIDEAITIADRLTKKNPKHIGVSQVLAEAHNQKGVSLIQHLSERFLDATETDEQQLLFDDAIKYLDMSLAVFKRMETIADLNPGQKVVRDGVVAMKNMAIENFGKILETPQSDDIDQELPPID